MRYVRGSMYIYSVPTNGEMSFVSVSDSCFSCFEYILESDNGGGRYK